MEIAFLIGRIMFGGFFIINGMNHFTKLSFMVRFAESKGIPQPKLSVILTGLILILGGLGIILGAYVLYSLIALGLFLLAVSFKMHNFWSKELMGSPEQMGEMVNFMKNMALLGAILMMFILSGDAWPTALNWGV